MHHWIRWMAKLRWVVLLVWLAAALLSLFALPSLQDILRSSEQRYLPEGAESVAATRLLQNLDPESRSQSGAVIVLSRDQGLTEADIQWMHRLTAKIEADKVQLGVSGVVASQSEPELAERLLSRDRTTLLALVNLPGTDFEDATKQTISRLKALLADSPDGATAALTGNAPLSQDFQQSAETGLRRTEYLTIGLVLAILLLLFRSPITPLLPLVTIGASFIVARGLVAACAQWGIPVSHFTESFLIAVLFGAGTDYCILLLHRYREEAEARSTAAPSYPER
jgi:RND superfamily putative drug exporter